MNQITDDNAPQNPAADLALIREMMAAGRKRAGINGAHLVWWGALLATAFFLQFAMVVKWIPNWGTTIWLVMMAVGWAGSIYLGVRAGRSQHEHNPALEAYGAAWLAVGITMLVHMTASLLGEGTSPGTATTLAGGTIGAAFFVMAQVLKLRPLLLAAGGWWAIMAYAIYTTVFPKEILIVLSVASLVLILVPGLYLRRLTDSEG